MVSSSAATDPGILINIYALPAGFTGYTARKLRRLEPHMSPANTLLQLARRSGLVECEEDAATKQMLRASSPAATGYATRCSSDFILRIQRRVFISLRTNGNSHLGHSLRLLASCS